MTADQGRQPRDHGTRAHYGAGCRCEACREANRVYITVYNARRSAQFQDDPNSVTHGTVSAYRAHGCRCDACCAAERVRHPPAAVGGGINLPQPVAGPSPRTMAAVERAALGLDEALAAARALEPLERARAANALADLGRSLTGAAAALYRDAAADLVEQDGYAAAAEALGVTVRAVRRHVPAGQEHRPTSPAGKARRAVELYGQGWKLDEISIRLQMSSPSARAAVIAAGLLPSSDADVPAEKEGGDES